MNNLTIGEITTGVSVSGAYDYLAGINTDAIMGAIAAVNATGNVKNALRNGWQGKAEANFEANLDKSAELIVSELETIRKGIESTVTQLVEDYAMQDSNMVTVD